MNPKFELGDKVTDPVTGYCGIAVARTEYLWGCISIGVCSHELKDGKPVEWQWFDENRLTKDTNQKIGGPQPCAPER